MSKVGVLKTIQAPSLVGSTMQHAIEVLSAHNLNMRILSQTQDADLPDGTIISQVPQPQALIKPNQSLYVVVSQQPEPLRAPSCVNTMSEEVVARLKEQGIKVKVYKVPSMQPTGMCVAQSPVTGQPLSSQGMIVYSAMANPLQAYRLVPDLIGLSVHEVQELCDLHGILTLIQRAEGSREEIPLNQLTIVAQKPLAGSLIQRDKNISMHFLAR